MSKIKWRIFKEFPNYLISNTGLIKNKLSGRILKLRNDKDGYLDVMLSKCGFKKRFKVHRLVALTFIPNPESKDQVNHKDGIKINNTINNLEWATKKDNEQHSVLKELHTSKLKIKDVIKIRKLRISTNLTLQEIADIFNVSKSTISSVINKKSWEHV